MSQETDCSSFAVPDLFQGVLDFYDFEMQYETFKKIQICVVVTIFVLLLQLGHLIKPFAYGVLRHLSLLSYLLVPFLISYILGLMGQPIHILPSTQTYFFIRTEVVTFRYMTCVWTVFLLFAYAGFDSLNAFSLEERYGRSKLVLQIGIQFSLLILVLYQIPFNNNIIALSFAFIVLSFKFVGRLLALAHSAGATPRIKNDVMSIINYMNRTTSEHDTISIDSVTTVGFDYLVGPKYTKLKDEGIDDGITMGKMMSVSGGKLMGSSSENNMELENMCLSFSLFWLLLGKFWSYPLYDDSKSSSRAKAWRLVRHGLLSEEGGHERVFRVIEVELAFLRDYFHARYLYFYLSGFYWKLITLVALPPMFWWFIKKAIDYNELNDLKSKGYGNVKFTGPANAIVITTIVALELIQLVVFIYSKWLKITLLCFYVKKMESNNTGFLSRVFVEVLRSIFLVSLRNSNNAWWKKPWKRELDQFSVVQDRTVVPKPASYLWLQFISVVGIPLPKPNRYLDKRVVLSDQVKQAVVFCLQRNNTCPKLNNGVESLRRNGVINIIPDWACNINNNTETILVWHIATTVCELHDSSCPQSSNDMKVATNLSKYCAYLLFFAPALLPVPALVAENICDTVDKEAIILFKKSLFSRKKGTDMDKYNELMNLVIIDEEAEFIGRGKSVLKKGVKLGDDLVKSVSDEGRRWKILAEFWAEMILYLAPSNTNELAHAEKLSQGGEFITQLWALLIHAGIYDRDDMDEGVFENPESHI